MQPMHQETDYATFLPQLIQNIDCEKENPAGAPPVCTWYESHHLGTKLNYIRSWTAHIAFVRQKEELWAESERRLAVIVYGWDGVFIKHSWL